MAASLGATTDVRSPEIRGVARLGGWLPGLGVGCMGVAFIDWPTPYEGT